MSAQRTFSVADVSLKLLVLGDHSVGKTCLVDRYVKGSVKAQPRSTVAVDTYHKKTTIGGVRLDLHIWDTAGQERYRALTSHYYREAKGALLVFDITREDTLLHLKKYWIAEALALSSRDIVCILVGNKSDRQDIRAVNQQAIKDLCVEYQLTYVETSAITGDSVTDAFEKLVSSILDKQAEPSITSPRRTTSEQEDRTIVLPTPNAAPNDSVSSRLKQRCCTS